MIKENFIRLFENSIKENWDVPAFTDYIEEQTLTYAEVGTEVAKLHLLFDTIGIEKGTKVSLIGKNGTNWCVTYIAVVTYGAVIVPILQDFNPNDVHHIVNHSDSTLFFAGDNIWENLEEEKLTTVKAVFSLTNFNCTTILNKVPKPLLEENESRENIISPLHKSKLTKRHIEDLFAHKYPYGFNKDSVRYIDKSNAELVSINYTSGTTGFSKGVMTSGNALAGNVTFAVGTGLIAPGFNIVAFLPLAHAYGCAFDFLASACAGCHIHFIGRTPSPKILLKAFAEVRPNVIFCVPLIIEKIYKKQIQPLLARPSMRWVLSIPLLDQPILAQIRKKLVDAFGGNFSQIVVGGAPLNAEVEEFFAKGQKGSSAMPHKRNPIGSENMTGLARVIRGHAVTAYENIALWHERDISHSSAERIIAADTTILINYMLNRFGNIVKNLTVFPENMIRNMNSTFGLIYSQRVMLKLIEKGMTREEAYDLVQPKTAYSWDNQVDFKPLLEADDQVTSRLSQDEIDELFNPIYYTKRVDEVFDRIGLGE